MENDILKPIYLLEKSFDDGNFDIHKSLLTDDFKFRSPFGSFDVVLDYMTWLQSFYEVVNKQGGTRHLIINPIITEIAENKAQVSSYLVIINKKTMNLMGTSVVDDTLVFSNHIWKCSDRVITTDQSLT